MSNTTVTSSSNSTVSTTGAGEAVDYQQRIADAKAALLSAAQQMGRSAYAQVQETVTKLYNDYAEALKNPSQAHDYEKDFVQLEAMKLILNDPIKDDAEDPALLKKEKEAADKEFREVTKKYSKSETQLAQEEKLKGKTDAKVANEHQERANRLTTMRTDLLRANSKSNSELTGNLVKEQAGREKFFGLAALIKAPKAPQPQHEAAHKPVSEALPKDAKQTGDKTPPKAQAKLAQGPEGEEIGDDVELAEAFGKDFEKPVDGQDSEVAVKDAESDLETVDGQENADGTKNNPQESMHLVQVALATGVLQRSATAQFCKPDSNPVQTTRDIHTECNGLNEECSGDAMNSAMTFMQRGQVQGAVRNTRVKGLETLIKGNARNGEPEAALAELQRVKKSVGFITANGVAGQGTTTPASILGPDGKVDPRRSQEQLAATLGQTARLDAPSIGPLSCYARSVNNWSAKDRADTVSAVSLAQQGPAGRA